MLYVVDASALIKRYHPEAGTSVVQRIFQEDASVILVSVVALVETLAAFQRLHRQRLVTPRELSEILSRFYGDLRSKRMAVLDVGIPDLELCHQLVFKHHLSAGDALILAAAITMRAQRPVFVSADVRSGLLRAAEASGLSTLNPLSPSV